MAVDVLTRRMPDRLRFATEAFVALIVLALMITVLAQLPGSIAATGRNHRPYWHSALLAYRTHSSCLVFSL